MSKPQQSKLRVATVPLPGPSANEPSIGVTDSGVIVVTAPTGGGPGVVTNGGYVWTSTDGGSSYSLVVDPRDVPLTSIQVETPGTCSCDTDVAIEGNTAFVATMYWTVNPIFDVVITSSQDGTDWMTQSIAAAQRPPIDRPWISASPSSPLLLTYTQEPLGAIPLPHPILMQSSTDGGRSWSAPTTVIADSGIGGTGNGDGYYDSKPSIRGNIIVVPLEIVPSGARGNLVNAFAVSQDGGATFEVKNVSRQYPYYDLFNLNAALLPDGTVAAVWSEPDENGTQRVWFQTYTVTGEPRAPKAPVDEGTNSVLPAIAARADGSLSVAFYASNESGPLLAKPASWYPTIVFLDPAHDISGRTRLTEDPVYTGILCNFSAQCPKGQGSSPMREFLSTAWGTDGRSFTAFVDASAAGSDQRGVITVGTVQFDGAVSPRGDTTMLLSAGP